MACPVSPGCVIEQIELQAKLLNYFLGSNKSNINVLVASGLRAEKFPRSIRHLEFWSECKPAVSISNFARALILDLNFVDH